MKSNIAVYPKAKAFVPYLQAVGRGQRSGRSLTQDEACTAMTMLLENQITPEQRGAFLMLLRVREETAEEIAGFVRACRATLPHHYSHEHFTQGHSSQGHSSQGHSSQGHFLQGHASHIHTYSKAQVDLDLGAYAGKRRQLPWFLLAVACLVEQGVTVGMHGTQEPESQRLYIQSVLSQLSAIMSPSQTSADASFSAPIDAPFMAKPSIWQATSAADIGATLSQYGCVYADLALVHPQLNALIQLRELFGLRSCANTLARILNPFDAAYSMQGVHHKHVDDKHVAVAKLLNEKNVMCVRGEGGEPEVDPSKDSVLKLCRAGDISSIHLSNEQAWEIKPKALHVETLALVWQGAQMHSYGENTVISTLACLLILLEGQSQERAFLDAAKLFKARNHKRFLGADIHNQA